MASLHFSFSGNVRLRAIVSDPPWIVDPHACLPFLFAFAAAMGCSGPSTPRALDVVFAEIQEHEATIAHRAADAEDCEDPSACPAMSEVCAAADAICDLARESEDADAAARCALAHRQCRSGDDTTEEREQATEEREQATQEPGTSAPPAASAPPMPSPDEETAEPEAESTEAETQPDGTPEAEATP